MSDISAVQNLLCKVSTWLKEKQEIYLQKMEASMTQEEMKEWKNIVLNNSASFKSAKAIAENFDQIRNAALVEIFDLWAKDHQPDIDSNDLADGGDLRLKCEINDLVFDFGFSSPNFRNFYFGLRWKDSGSHILDNKRFPPQDSWQQNDWFPYSKYFEKEFRNPGMDDDLLFSEDKKNSLWSRLDAALEEMNNLIAKIK